jgi:hypothetical protein
MSHLFINADGEYPRHPGDVQLVSPGWEEGDALPEGWVAVEESTYPTEIPADHKVVEEPPVEVDGVWRQQWAVVPLTEEEIAWRDAPITAKQKLSALGLSEAEISALARGLVR